MQSFKEFANQEFIKVNDKPPAYHLINKNHKSLYISGVIHGDEQSALPTLKKLIKNPEFFKHLDVTIVPCLNPWGYKNNTRDNEKGHDLNRDYKNGHQIETQSHLNFLEGKKWDFGLCLHESKFSDGCFIYEPKEFQLPDWSDAILDAMTTQIPLDTTHRHADSKQERGVLIDTRYKESKHWTESIYLTKNLTPTVTLEVPTSYPMDQRMACYIAGIKKCILNLH